VGNSVLPFSVTERPRALSAPCSDCTQAEGHRSEAMVSDCRRTYVFLHDRCLALSNTSAALCSLRPLPPFLPDAFRPFLPSVILWPFGFPRCRANFCYTRGFQPPLNAAPRRTPRETSSIIVASPFAFFPRRLFQHFRLSPVAYVTPSLHGSLPMVSSLTYSLT